MSGSTRPARVEELPRLWPLVRSARLIPDLDTLVTMHTRGPWQVRVADEGDVLVVGRWREHLDVLAIRGIWAPADRMGGLIRDACAVARSRGLTRVISPLLEEHHTRAYRECGMTDLESLTACTASVDAVVIGAGHSTDPGSSPMSLRAASAQDVAALAELDAACFDDFWRHGAAEIADALSTAHVTVADVVVDGDVAAAAYSISLSSGSTVTIGRLAVSPRHRRSGLGGALLQEAAGWARSLGARGLSLCTQSHNSQARALYRSAGFAELPDDYRLLVMDAPG